MRVQLHASPENAQKNIQKFIDFYKITKNVFSNTSTRKYCKNLIFFLKNIILIYLSFLFDLVLIVNIYAHF